MTEFMFTYSTQFSEKAVYGGFSNSSIPTLSSLCEARYRGILANVEVMIGNYDE